MSLQPPQYRPQLEAVPIIRKYIKELKTEYKDAKIRRSITILQTIAELQEQIEWIENNYRKK